MSEIQNHIQKIDAPRRDYYTFMADTVQIVTQSGVSYNLFLPLTEKGNVVDVKSEAQTKRVYHALHEKTPCQRCGYKSSNRWIEAKQVCLYGFNKKLVVGNLLNPLLNRS